MGLARLERSVLAALWLLLVAVVSLNSLGLPSTDIKPEVYLAPAQATAGFLSAWQSGPYLGSPSFNVGLAPVTALLSVLAWAGLSPEVIFKVFRIVLLTVGAAGARRLYRHLAGEQGGAAGVAGRVAVAVAYVANPYVVVAGSTLAVVLPYALLPWQTYALVRALEAPRGWRWPAVFALTFAAMTGVNAGVVPLMQLVSVPTVLLVFLVRREVTRRHGVAVVLRCGLLSVLLSLYWLVPALSAVGAGSTVVENSESVDAIAGTSSAAEVIRGLGLWPMYGSVRRDPGSRSSPRTSRPALLCSRPSCCRCSRSPRLGSAPVASAPSPSGCSRSRCPSWSVPVRREVPSPFGAVLKWAFETVPALSAFRTTNKVGAVLVLGLALLVGAGSVAAARRLSLTAGVVLASVVAAAVVTSTFPAFSGHLHPSPVDVPDYWRVAATDLDRGPADQRIWMVPGQVEASYRWSEPRPDDVATPCSTGLPWCGRSSR